MIDELAERMAMLGGNALPTLKDVLSRASLKEDSNFPAAKDMVALFAAIDDTANLLDDLTLPNTRRCGCSARFSMERTR